MYGGYLVIETDRAHPGLVRILETASMPAEPNPPHREGHRVIYAARFDDLSAAHMHAHAAMRRHLLDVDAGLYRIDPVNAVAAVDASDLSHRRVYLERELADDPDLARAVAGRRKRYRLNDRIWQSVGIAAALILLTKLLLGF